MIYLGSKDLLLFQGDSITHGGRVESLSDLNHIIGHGYQDYLAQEIGVANISRNPAIVNRGVSGDNIDRLTARVKEDIIDLKPTVMSLLIGINDATGYCVNGDDLSTPRFEEKYRSLLDTVQEALPELCLILCQPFRYIMPDSADMELQARIERDVREKSAAVERIAADYGAVFVRFWDALDTYAKRCPIKQLVWDGVHPTYVGHGVMAKCWLETVEREL